MDKREGILRRIGRKIVRGVQSVCVFLLGLLVK